MIGEKKCLEDIRFLLDGLFSLSEWKDDPAMSRWVPFVYKQINYDFSQIFEKDFCQKFNGLMLSSGGIVDRIYCAAFPKTEILLKILSRPEEKALLFLHHPIDMQVSGKGFLPIDPILLERMRRQGNSIYACHAPMDCQEDIGTTTSIATAFGVKVEGSFGKYGRGFSGRIGTIQPVDLQRLIKIGLEIFGVDRVEIGGAKLDQVSKIAIVAGGGDDPLLFEEAKQLGAEVYITGEWFTRTKPEDKDGKLWAEANRAACFSYAQNSRMAFLGFSHAATEYLVLRKKFAPFITHQGITVDCLPQSDWWE